MDRRRRVHAVSRSYNARRDPRPRGSETRPEAVALRRITRRLRGRGGGWGMYAMLIEHPLTLPRLAATQWVRCWLETDDGIPGDSTAATHRLRSACRPRRTRVLLRTSRAALFSRGGTQRCSSSARTAMRVLRRRMGGCDGDTAVAGCKPCDATEPQAAESGRRRVGGLCRGLSPARRRPRGCRRASLQCSTDHPDTCAGLPLR
jgi:hypothetical protein